MKNISIIFILMLSVSQIVTAESDNKFHLQWDDIFPMCAADDDEYNVVRCGCEFVVPNFHIGLIGDMFMRSVSSFLLLDGIIGFITDVVDDPVGAVGGFIGGIVDSIKETLFPSSPEQGISNTLENIINSLISWFFGIVTPLIVVFMILFIEFIKTYLCIAIPFVLWMQALHEVNLVGKPSSMWGVYIAGVTVILMFFGSVYLLGSDFGLYKPLVVW